MIRQFDEPHGKSPIPSSPRALLQSMERLLSQSQNVTDQKSHDAQQLVYDAWQAPTEAAAKKLIASALKLDPSNVDALLQAMVYAGVQGEEQIEVLRKVVAIGEKNLGPKEFKQLTGAFWGFLETRPYMRARARLADALRSAGRPAEAIAEWQAMLELNPNDNQGVRYALISSLLEMSRLDEVRDLFDKYSGEFEFNAVFAWGRVLERFLSDDPPGAKAALNVARKQNPHVQAYIKGNRQLPRYLPASYSPGSKDEALCFADGMRAAWKMHPAALQWLDAQKLK